LVNIAGSAALLVLLRRRLERLELAQTFRAIGLIMLASAALAGVAYGVWYGVDSAAGRSLGGNLLSVVVALGVGVATYVAACRALGVRELDTLLSLRSRVR
jgi:hypothetical protein